MSVRELLRSRIAVILFLIIPTLFYAVILLTTTHKEIVFRLASVSEEMFIRVSQRQEALVFIGLAAVGLLTSFLALNLTQKHAAGGSFSAVRFPNSCLRNSSPCRPTSASALYRSSCSFPPRRLPSFCWDSC
jgi:hypothetical protein